MAYKPSLLHKKCMELVEFEDLIIKSQNDIYFEAQMKGSHATSELNGKSANAVN